MTLDIARPRSLPCIRSGAVLLACALLANVANAQARLYTWGIQGHGPGGTGQVSQAPVGPDFIDMATGDFHGLAVRADGSLVSWGSDSYNTVSDTPTGTGFTSVAVGQFHSLAMRSDGSIVGWGGDFDQQVSLTPVEPGFVSIAAEKSISMALRPDGSIVTWGDDGNAQVLNTPPGIGFKQVEAAPDRCWALRADGSIIWWGSSKTNLVMYHPTEVGFTQISVSRSYGLALRPDGSIVQWGLTLPGLPTGTGFVQVAAREIGGAALDASGSLFVWGWDLNGVVSDAPAGRGYSRLKSSSAYFAMALRSDDPGAAYCFGDGSGMPCPCAASGPPGSGCTNTTGSGATLVGSGPAFTAVDGFQLELTGLPAQTPGLLLRGSAQFGGGLGTPMGDGLLCVAGQTARSHVQVTSAAGTTQFIDFAGQSFTTANSGLGVPTNYQFWYRDASNPCSGTGFNFSNAWTSIWRP